MDFNFERNVEVGFRIIAWPVTVLGAALVVVLVGMAVYQSITQFNWQSVFMFFKVIGVLAGIVASVFGSIYGIGFAIQVLLPRIWRKWTVRIVDPVEEDEIGQPVAWQREGF